MNFGELRTAVRLRAHVPSTDGIWTDSFVDDAVNEALQSISLEQPWPWLEVTESVTGGTNPIDMSAFSVAVRDIKTVFVDSDQAHSVSTADIDGWDNVQAERARWVWASSADDLLIRPEPTSSNTVKVRYFRNEPVLTSDATSPLMPAVYHYAIVHRAASIGFEGIDDQSSAAMHEARARGFIERMEATALRKARGPHRPRIRPGSQL